MRKYFAAILLSVFCSVGLAQSIKIGRVNLQVVFEAMPESAIARQEIEYLEAKYQVEISKLEEEYKNKVAQFLEEKDQLLPNIQDARSIEIDQLAQRIQKFRETAAEDLRVQQESKIAPIMKRIESAIQSIGEREGFSYVFDQSQGNILYFNQQQCVDILPLVLKELRIESK